ncbi:unnamed protein product [Timema podura]|uniref:Uncharacterized protein n=1 Tax=Timema podura TaxID=61482 RepID=A0ABN7NVN6_TIMPD|nr:unnamed protein product [Timema podura]
MLFDGRGAFSFPNFSVTVFLVPEVIESGTDKRQETGQDQNQQDWRTMSGQLSGRVRVDRQANKLGTRTGQQAWNRVWPVGSQLGFFWECDDELSNNQHPLLQLGQVYLRTYKRQPAIQVWATKGLSEKGPQREVVETIKLVEAGDTCGGNSLTASSPKWSKTWPQHLSAFLVQTSARQESPSEAEDGASGDEEDNPSQITYQEKGTSNW